MSRRTLVIGLAVAALVVATGFGLYTRISSATPPGVIAVAGDVRAELYTVRAPSITQPVPDYTVGLPATSTAAPKKSSAVSPGAMKSRAPVVSGLLTEVLVTEGSRVTTGQVLARLDTTMLDLGVASAEAARAKAAADVDALERNISKLEDTRAKLVTARKKLTTVRASLATTIGVLVDNRTALQAQIAVIEALIAQPGGPPPHVPPYPVLLAGMKSALAGLNAGLTGARTGLTTIDSNLVKLRAGIAKIDSALSQMRDGRELARINIRSKQLGVEIAKARLAAATITSPASGLVTYARLSGTTVMVGTPLMRIVPDGPVRVDTYLTSEELATVGIGTRLSVDYDSNTGPALSGRIVTIGLSAVVPPTSFPTAIVHMTRAVRVTIELDEGAKAPAGTPVDIVIRTGSAR